MKWVKPSGIEIETNDNPETIAYCEKLGWKKAGAKKAAPKKKAARKKAE